MLESAILCLPFLSSLLSFLSIKNYKLVNQVFSSLLIACAAVSSWFVMLSFHGDYSIHIIQWFSVGNLSSNWSISVTRVSSIMFTVVTTISSIIHFYSIGYMKEDPGIGRFFCYISLFVFFMIVLVGADDLFQLFCGWEGVGVCSYLLIGFGSVKIRQTRLQLKRL